MEETRRRKILRFAVSGALLVGVQACGGEQTHVNEPAPHTNEPAPNETSPNEPPGETGATDGTDETVPEGPSEPTTNEPAPEE